MEAAYKTGSDKALVLVFYVLISVFALICLIPFFLVVGSSFTDEVALIKNGYNLWPRAFSINAYRLAFNSSDIPNAYKVTIFVTAAGTSGSMLLTCGVAYAMSVKSFRSRRILSFFIYFTMLFNGGLVANYLLISKYLDLKDNILAIILPGMLNAYNIFLMRNFFAGIPDSLAESAKIDGANDVMILFKIILPVSLPGLATISLFYALGYWNEWYRVLLYISDSGLFTLQYLIMRILRQINYASTLPGSIMFDAGTLPTYSYRMAAVVLTIGPIIFLYPFVQKYFVSGLTVGSVKG